MINQIKKVIIDNKKQFNIEDINQSDIKVSKFFHGNPSVNTKVLFFISIFNKPICLIKISRKSEFNDFILRETEGIKYFQSINLKTPKVFFDGTVNDLRFICQEVIEGKNISKKEEYLFLKHIINYHSVVKKNKEIKIQEILNLFSGLRVDTDSEFKQAIDMLIERKDDRVFLSSQHGDLTYKNILKKDNEVCFIDFENFNLRPIWGIDLVHYLTRLTDSHTRKRGLSDTLSFFMSESEKCLKNIDIGLSNRDLENLFLLNFLFEVLQKNLISLRTDIIPKMLKIWSI
jgi:hypothetical protein